MKKHLLYLSAILLCFGSLSAQRVEMSQLKNIKIRSIGPAAMSGRVTAIAVDPKLDHVIYAGTASGGVWRSKSAGATWQPIFDKAPTQSIGSIAINPTNPDDIWVGTGEGNPRNSQNFGAGIFRSIDGGLNWKYMGLGESRAIHRVIIHRDNPQIVWAAVIGSSNGPSTERGVFKTTDGGQTWRKVLYVNDLTGCADLVVDAHNPNKLVAGMWEYRRWPWFFKSGGAGSGIHISHDGGETWKKVTDKDGLPEGELGRVGLAISPANSDIVYALVEAKDNAMYKSIDGGKKWQKMADKGFGNRPFYYGEIFADPKDENRVYSIHTTISVTEDGAKTFEDWVGWEIHVDHHAFWIDPKNPNYIIDGNDGGLNITYDRGKTWRFAENIPVGQFYHINVDNEVPYNVYGGLQDNGSWFGPSAVYRESEIRNADWQEVVFGDGFDVAPCPADNRYLYGMYQGGNMYRVDKKTGHNVFIKPNHPEALPLRYNWNAALAVDPFNGNALYYGSQMVHYSTDRGDSWQIISPDLTTNDTSKMHQDISGGLTLDATNAENHCTIIAIAPSPLNKGQIWVGTDDGNLQFTRDGGKTWENQSTRLPACPKNAWIPQIEVSRSNAAEAWVVVNNYRQNDFAPYLYHTTDYGKTWTGLSKQSGIKSFCLSVVQDKISPSLVFLGTDDGLYVSFDTGNTWNKWDQESFPSVPVQDMKVQEREADLVIGTFGRAIWIMDDITPLREIASSQAKVLNDSLRVFAPTPATDFATQSYTGVRFIGSTIYEGENDPQGMHLKVWVHPSLIAAKTAEKEEKKDKKKDEKKEEKKEANKEKSGDDAKKSDKKDDAKITVMDMKGDTVRQISRRVDSCMNVIRWRLDTKGIRWASNKANEKEAGDAQQGGGPVALPGRYKVVVAYKGLSDSTFLEVKMDPRITINEADYRNQYDAMQQFYKQVSRATDAYDRLKEMESTMSRVETAYTNVPDSLKKSLVEDTKTLRDSINVMKDQFFTQKEPKGIQRNPNTINALCYQALSYLREAHGAPNPNGALAVQQATTKIDQMIARVNNLQRDQWAAWRKKAEEIRFSLFKDWEEIK